MDRGAWWAIDHGVTELDTTEHAHTHTHTHTHTQGPASSPGPVSELVVSSGWPSSKPPPGLHWASLSPGRTTGSHCCTFISSPLLLGSRPLPRAGPQASGRLPCSDRAQREQSLQQLFCSCWLSVWACSRHLLGNVGKK